MHPRFARFAVLIALVLATTGALAVRAQCEPAALVPSLLTPVTASLPRDGASLVVGVRATPGATATPLPPSLRLVRGRRTQELTATPIAPGLARYAAGARLQPGSFTLEGLRETRTLSVGREPMPGIPTRPALREARIVASTGIGATGPLRQVRARLDFPLPDNVVALLLYWGDATAPSAWRAAIPGQSELVVWAEATACDPAPDGAQTPPETGSLRVAFVDRFGQISPISPSVRLE